MPSPQGAFGLRRHGCQDARLPRKGHSALGFGQAKPMMMYIMGFWSSESASTPHGEERSPCNNKNPYRTADGTLRVRITTAGGSSPHCRASREDITLARGSNTFDPYVRGCAAHGVILLTGHTRRLTIPAAKQRGRLAVCTYLRGFLGWHVGSIEIDPYGSRAGFPSGEPMHV